MKRGQRERRNEERTKRGELICFHKTRVEKIYSFSVPLTEIEMKSIK